MPKIVGSVLSGPIRSKDSRVGANAPLGRSATITLTAQGAGIIADYTFADVNAMARDVISVSPRAPQVGIASLTAWCAVDGTITVRVLPSAAGALTAGAQVLDYTITK